MHNFSVTCFGTGDGWPCADRNHAAFLYRMKQNTILIDCGDPIDRSYKASGLSYDLIDAIFISHLHSDHFGGFFMLMQGCWLEGRTKPLPVYLPAGAIKPLRAMLNAGFLFDEIMDFRLELRPIPTDKTFSVGKVRIKTFPTTHLAHAQARFQKIHRSDYSAFGFLMEMDGRRMVHSADLGRPEDLDPVINKPLDLLVCELAHFSPEAMFSYLEGRKIKRIEFIHVGRPFHENIARTRRLAAKMLPGIPHSFPRDHTRVDF
jgi:ribonuclease Z